MKPPIRPFALAILVAAPAPAQDTPSDLRDMVGARAGQAEGELIRRGYRSVRSQAGDDRRYTYWWNKTYGRCVTVATMDGRYDSITETPAPDCGRGGALRERPATVPAYAARPGYDDDGQGDNDRFTVEGRPVELGLVCFGEGQGPDIANRAGWSWNPRRDRYDYGNRMEMTERHFDAALTVQVWPGGGRVRLPKSLIPPINSRGRDGWWDLRDVTIDPDRVTASYRLNGLNKPTMTIDRRSGRISVAGTPPYGFRGTCDMVDGRDHRRF